MQLSRKADYGIRGILYLALQPAKKVTPLGEIATAQAIPPSFLPKILQELVRGGIVRSHRGSHGGFSLAKPPREITLLEIIQAIEGPLALNLCLICPGRCPYEHICAVRPVWQKAQRLLTTILGQTTLAALAQNAVPYSAPMANRPAVRVKPSITSKKGWGACDAKMAS